MNVAEGLMSWTTEQVGKWVKAAGFPEYEKSFIDNDVTGDVLVELNHDILKEMGIISTGKRVKLLKHIEDLKARKLPRTSTAGTTTSSSRHRSLAEGTAGNQISKSSRN